jgi:GPH family glycoside/pentoside/hexuronide:cation symporter
LLISKAGTALSLFLSGQILNLWRLRCEHRSKLWGETGDTLDYRPIPAVIFLAEFVLMQLYPLDEKTCKKLMGQ